MREREERRSSSRDRGSFAVGGTVITAPGTFDPIKQGAFNPAGPDSAGQTLHGDHAYVFYHYGDNIPESPSETPGSEQWRVFLQVARSWRDAVNRHGGDVTVVHLPEIGIRGNTHFPMSDLNNVQVADHLSQYLATKGLDR